MKRSVLFVLGVLAITTSAFAQAPAPSDPIERALLAAPARAKDATTVIKFKADGTYDTLKKGTNQLVCYDRSGDPGEQPFSVQCTNLANIPRVIQNRKFEAIADKAERQKALDAAEKDGTRAKPEFGSVWLTLNGPDKDKVPAHVHTTIAVPGATTASLGLPDNPQKGGVWIMNAGTSTAHLMTPGS